MVARSDSDVDQQRRENTLRDTSNIVGQELCRTHLQNLAQGSQCAQIQPVDTFSQPMNLGWRETCRSLTWSGL